MESMICLQTLQLLEIIMQILLETTDPYEFTTQNNTKDERRADFFVNWAVFSAYYPASLSFGPTGQIWDFGTPH